MKASRYLIALAAVTVALSSFFLLTHQREPASPAYFSGLTMGTTFSITLAGTKSQDDLDSVKSEIIALLDRINQQMSTYVTSSEVTRFNNFRDTDWFTVSADTAQLVSESLQISDLTDGSFDITVGPLVDLWGFGPDPRRTEAPPDAEIARLKENIGYKNVVVRLHPPALRKLKKTLRIDLSAIAKGYAVDQVGLLLKEKGFTDFIVEIGGELLVCGEKAPGTPWQIGIESPVTDRRQVDAVLPVKDIAMATSGDYRNYFEDKGKRYSHTIDPRTGYPITHNLVAVTVMDSSCAKADALATALMVMGPEKAQTFAESRNIAAFLIVKTGDGFVEHATTAFDRLSH